MYFDPASPPVEPEAETQAPAVEPFAGVPEALHAALQRRGFQQLTAVQQAILAADDGARDLRISSQTGSGKTVALGFALCRAIHDAARRGPTTLIIAPTRELAVQVKDELAWLFADLRDVDCESVTGGTSVSRERQRLHQRPAVVVGTPGRLLDHIRERALDLSSVHQLVLDEADQMLDLGFKDELDGILAALPKVRRTHLVSATFPRAVVDLANRFQRNALLVAGTAPGSAHADIEHVALRIHAREHYAALVNLLLLAGDERTLVFVRTREDTTGLADKLAVDGFSALPISGDLAQAQRTRTLAAFKRGTIRTLIATDVAARGLDVQDVTMVVHVDLPMDNETYVHRSGRTGRAGQKGRSVMLVLKSHEGRARRIYANARIQPVWMSPPDADAVAQRRLQRAEERAMAAVAAHGVDDNQRALAAHLLQGREAVEVVAALLNHAAAGPRAPFPFAAGASNVPAGKSAAPVRPRAAPARAHATRSHAAPADVAPSDAPQSEPGESHARPHTPPHHKGRSAAAHADAGPTDAAEPRAPRASDEPEASERPARTPRPTARALPPGNRGRAGALPAWRRPADTDVERGFTRFRINWGTRDGADARRILAHICRRGGIESRAVGAIELQLTASQFDVDDRVAADFARAVRTRDRRDPHLVIVRATPARPRSARPATPDAELEVP